ncbi:DUF3330 domain-containing protein [Thiohalomonas denitrificans]|uniref:DUF3330 domain-containing protein n=1 Tax=Thiohalomonas denitrificans TaxID=415747 RepID=A0A1G5PLJ9_9GAMM|nr:DUF3330 domain-containing protein [Thiohalomonas denitrificans]SCZ50020.1 protein of unknown function [Thiohalomonas denitrificans]
MDPNKFKRHDPEEPEHVSCHVCLKEIPSSSGHTAEGVDYIYHFCGVECLEEWKQKEKRDEGPLDHPEDV